MGRPAPICVPCRLEMRCVRNGRLVCDPSVGNLPSTYWAGDQWRCPECGAEVVAGFGRPIVQPRPRMEGDPEPLQFDYQRDPRPKDSSGGGP